MPTPTAIHRLLHRSRRSFRAAIVSVTILVCLAATGTAGAQSAALEDPARDADARLRGYEESNVVIAGRSVALAYFAFIGLTIVAGGVMFKSARRTHLD